MSINVPAPVITLIGEVIKAILTAKNPTAAARRALAAARHRAVVEAAKARRPSK